MISEAPQAASKHFEIRQRSQKMMLIFTYFASMTKNAVVAKVFMRQWLIILETLGNNVNKTIRFCNNYMYVHL